MPIPSLCSLGRSLATTLRWCAIVTLAGAIGCAGQREQPLPTDAPPAAELLAPTGPAVEVSDMALEFERSMTAHTAERYLGTLEEIKRRGVLRVGMLNNAVSYFVYRGQEVGFQYELAALWAARLSVRLQVVVPERPGDMLTLLKEHRADIVPVRTVDTTDNVLRTRPFVFADYLLVQHRDAPPINTPGMLAGQTVHARRSSRYWPLLETLRPLAPGLNLVAAPEATETEALIGAVGDRLIPMTVSNSLLLQVEQTYRDDVLGTLTIAEDQGLSYAVHPETPDLYERLDGLLERTLDTATYRTLYAKYFENPRRMGELRSGQVAQSGTISPYDEIIRRHAEAHGLDWRLIAAQMYQESRFDPKARSWVGARGLMQLMPRTAQELGVTDIEDPEQNIGAGVRYLAQLARRFEDDLDPRQRVRFALASYNAGYYHVVDARNLAKRLGIDPNRWFGQVEKAMVLLEQPKYYRRARFGYCRGREPVEYVSRIQSKYDGYVTITRGGTSISLRNTETDPPTPGSP